MSLAKFSVKNPVLINLFMFLVFIVGAFTLLVIPKEENPAVDFGNIMITVIYPGVSPSEIESTIINKIEKEISDVDNIDNIQSWANEDAGTISITFEPNADIDKAWNDINAELDKVNDLPEDALDPMILRINMREVAPICDISISGQFSGNAMRDIAEDLQDGILDIDHISKVDVFGTRQREIKVEADAEKLELYQIAIQDVIDAINGQNFNLPGGIAKGGKSEFLVRMMGEFDSMEDIGKLIVSKSNNGTFVRIKDIATVKDTLEERSVVSKLNSEESVVLYVYKKAEGNVISVVKNIRAYLEKFKQSTPGLSVALRNDVSVDVKNSIGTLGNSAVIGIGLVFLCLWAFLGWRNAFFAAIGIPFSFFLTFAIMQYFGLSLNTLSLFALVLVLGMIVDDAIVVIENVHRYMELGFSAKEAAIKGTEEIMWPVIAAVTTTASAFFPMLLMEGMMGKFMRVFPIVVGIALLASLIESLVVLPSHLADFAKIKKHKKESHFFTRIQNAYKRILIVALKYRFLSVFSILILALGCIGILRSGLITFEFFPQRFPSTIILQMKLPVGTTLEETEVAVSKVENFIQNMNQKNDVQAMITNVGLIDENYSWDTKTHNAQIKLDFVERDDMENTPDEIKASIREFVNTVPEIISFKFALPPDGPPTGKDVEIRIRGDKLNELEIFGEQVVEILEQIPGVVDVQHDFNIGKKELRIRPIQEKMQQYGLNYAMIASTVRSANYGTEVSKFRGEDGQEYDFFVSYKTSYIEKLEAMKSLKIRTMYGTLISLSDVAEFTIERGLSRIVHYDKKRAITITANTGMFFDEKKEREVKRTPDQVSNILFGSSLTGQGLLSDFEEKNPGYTIKSGGVAEEQRKSYGSLYLAFIVAIILIYSILASQFRSYVQPLIVMTTVPFAFIGVIFGLLVTNLPFSLTTLVAFVALAGVVVNDSLVLVDFVNSLRDKGLDRWSSLIEAGATRLRPIILTTVTTISGLMPMILSNSKATEDWKPMAVSIVFGLSFATILTLIVIPCIYSIVDSIFGFLKITRFKDHTKLRDVIDNFK